MKVSIVFLMLFSSSVFLYAQNPLITARSAKGSRTFPDSIRVEFPDQHGIMILQFLNFRQNPDAINKDLVLTGQILDRVEKSIGSIAAPRQVIVTVSPAGEQTIRISEAEEKITLLSATEKEITQLLPPGWEITVMLPRGKIYLYAQDFSALKTMTQFTPEPLKKLIEDDSKKIWFGRKRVIGRIFVQNGAMTFNEIKFQMPQDFIGLDASCGFGYFNTNFYPELNLNLVFRLGDRFNRRATKFTLSYNNLFFVDRTAEGSYRNRTNSFLNAAWSRNIGGSTYGTLGAGYLIHGTGDYFKGKTAKFFFTTNHGAFGITPELYLTNDFKTFNTGLKLTYTF